MALARGSILPCERLCRVVKIGTADSIYTNTDYTCISDGCRYLEM